jgi:signal transduction histidine kinase
MTATVTQRSLRRLRRELAALFGVTTMLALGVLSVVVFRIDDDLRWARTEEVLVNRAQQAAAAVAVIDGDLVVDRFEADDELTGGWPQVWVHGFGDEGLEAVAGPTEDWYGVDVAAAAGSAFDDDDSGVRWVDQLPDGDEVYSRTVPVVEPETGDTVALVSAVAVRSDFFAGEIRLRATVLASAVALTMAAVVAGYWLAGRGTRATARALDQQERLLAAAAHELRTPVARIRAVAEGGLAGDEAPEAALGRVDRLSRDAGTMVDDLLALARMDAGNEALEREPLRLDQLAESVAAQYPDVAVESVRTVVEGDPGLLRRAVDNLVRNAVTHGRAEVRVTVYPSRVVVADRGPGLDPTVADHVFDRFRTGPASPGHGLGLPIVRWVADAHGASVTVRDREGGGVEAVLDLA